MRTARGTDPVSVGHRQAIAFGLVAVGLLTVASMNWLPDAFPGVFAAPRPGYWVVLIGGFIIAMTGVVLSLRASAAWRRQQRAGTR